MSECGVGGWNGPLPGDPSSNSLLSAVSAFGGIDVFWTLPTTNPYAVAYTKLYRGVTADFADATLLREQAGTYWFDRLESGTYYYWIQFISVHGTPGEVIGPASASPKSLLDGMIEQLTGEIDAGLLAITLKNQLDQISILNANLLEEIFDRETGQTSLAAAIAAAQEGVAEAHTFILDEINTRTTETSALAEQIEGIAATLGDDFAAVFTAMTIQLDSLNDIVDAMWVAKVNVNGLVGGFGLYNDGESVEAGFDVDRFWIGRTSADKRKPFIVDSGVVYIDEAAIQKLTFTKLRDATGAVMIADGRIQADFLRVDNASIDDLSVSTLKVQDEAITAARFYEAADQTSIDSSFVTVLSATPPAGGGFICTVSFNASPVSGGVDAYGEVQVISDGIPLAWSRFGVRVVAGSVQYVMPVLATFVAAGGSTIDVRIRAVTNPGGSTINVMATEISMSIMSGKK